MTKWTAFVTKHYNTEKAKNKNYSFKQAMVDAAKKYKKTGGAEADPAAAPAVDADAPAVAVDATPVDIMPTAADATPVDIMPTAADENPAMKMGGKGKKSKGKRTKKNRTRKHKKH